MALAFLIVLAGGLYWGRSYLPAIMAHMGLARSDLGQAASGSLQKRAAVPPVAVYVATAKAEDLSRRLRAVGTLKASESVTISPEIAGRVANISPDQGERVAEGDLLAELDATIYLAQIADAEARMKLWRANAERAQSLMAKGAGTQKSVDETISELGIAEATLKLAEANLAKTRITAPFGGVLGLRQVSAGEYLTPGQPIFSLSRIDPLYVDFSLPQTELALARPGTAVDIETDAFPGAHFPGSIIAIDPELDAAARAISVRAEIANRDRSLKPGLFIEVSIDAGQIKDAVTIPEQALVARGDRVFVYAVEDGRAQLRPVTTGYRESGKVQVVDGVRPGDVIVTDGQMKLRPDADVKIVEP